MLGKLTLKRIAMKIDWIRISKKMFILSLWTVPMAVQADDIVVTDGMWKVTYMEELIGEVEGLVGKIADLVTSVELVKSYAIDQESGLLLSY